jgi:hypothetical protein
MRLCPDTNGLSVFVCETYAYVTMTICECIGYPYGSFTPPAGEDDTATSEFDDDQSASLDGSHRNNGGCGTWLLICRLNILHE